MAGVTYDITDNKVVIYTRGKICSDSEELLSSALFLDIVGRFVDSLVKQQSPLLSIFDTHPVDRAVVRELAGFLRLLSRKPLAHLKSENHAFPFDISDIYPLAEFVEELYDFWRNFDRFLLCDSEGDGFDKRPYRTFNATIESLTHLIRGAYRDVLENITETHPRIYRQVSAGAEIAAITIPVELALPAGAYERLKEIPVIRQVLINPPLILNPPMNKRTGQFVRIESNPLDLFNAEWREWLCYPAKVGPLLVLIYFHQKFFELGFTLCNLFEIAGDEDLKRKPDAVYTFGVDSAALDPLGVFPTVFYEDAANEIMVAAVPRKDEFGYFGYLKKMVLTLHNVKMMRAGKLPFHGAFVKIMMHGLPDTNILLIGDTGAGKSETLEAFRTIGRDLMRRMVIIADDMGSMDIDDEGNIIGYGTEIGAFLRLDDLQPGYGFGQIDRSIIMSPAQINARIVMPVTTYDVVMHGHTIDMILYANNYEEIDAEHPIIERFKTVEDAFNTFREGTVMSKGTTTSTGIVHSYFANIFGPPQYKEIHDKLALVFFNAFFSRRIFVGQLRTRLGISGYETRGPEEAARELLRMIGGDRDHQVMR